MVWIYSKRIFFVKCRTTTAKPIIAPSLISEIGYTFYHSINEVIKGHEISHEIVINIDRTFLPSILFSSSSGSSSSSSNSGRGGSGTATGSVAVVVPVAVVVVVGVVVEVALVVVLVVVVVVVIVVIVVVVVVVVVV